MLINIDIWGGYRVFLLSPHYPSQIPMHIYRDVVITFLSRFILRSSCYLFFNALEIFINPIPDNKADKAPMIQAIPMSPNIIIPIIIPITPSNTSRIPITTFLPWITTPIKYFSVPSFLQF